MVSRLDREADAIPNAAILNIATFVKCRIFRGTRPRHATAFGVSWKHLICNEYVYNF